MIAKTFPLRITTISLFIVLTGLGLTLARQKPLWNDEIYSQMRIIEELPYSRLLSGRFLEGNNCPLFYILQKALGELTGYQSPEVWREGTAHWSFDRVVDRLLLRINPVLFISASMTLIFAFFSRNYSVGAGLLSLFLALTSNMLWRYWAEARPYALWVFLTTAQILLFMSLTSKVARSKVLWRWLIGVHVLLALTSVLGVMQIIWVSALLFFFVSRKPRTYILVTILPLVISLWYYIQAPKFAFWLEFTVEQYIREGISRDRLYIMMIYVFFLGLYFLNKKNILPRMLVNPMIVDAGRYLIYMLGMIVSAIAVVWGFRFLASPDQQGFPVTDRYFIYLIPVGVIGTTVFLTTLWRGLKERIWLKVLIFSGVGYLLIHRAVKVIGEIKGYYPDWLV